MVNSTIRSKQSIRSVLVVQLFLNDVESRGFGWGCTSQHQRHKKGLPVKVWNEEQPPIDIAILNAVRLLTRDGQRKLTFGQIFMHLVGCLQSIPPIARCVEAVDALVSEGLLTSERVLEDDPTFPYVQHIISGLTEVGEASLG